MASAFTAAKFEVDDEPDSWMAGFKERKNKTNIWDFLVVLNLVFTSITAIAYFSSIGNAKPEPIPADYGESIPSYNGARSSDT